eukprot:1518728-Rhodomonas_salina.1
MAHSSDALRALVAVRLAASLNVRPYMYMCVPMPEYASESLYVRPYLCIRLPVERTVWRDNTTPREGYPSPPIPPQSQIEIARNARVEWYKPTHEVDKVAGTCRTNMKAQVTCRRHKSHAEGTRHMPKAQVTCGAQSEQKRHVTVKAAS